MSETIELIPRCPHCQVALEDFGPSHIVAGRNYWWCIRCRHSFRFERGILTDITLPIGLEEAASFGGLPCVATAVSVDLVRLDFT